MLLIAAWSADEPTRKYRTGTSTALKIARQLISEDRGLRASVLPKYQNPNNSAETWSGRGKQQRWLTAQLRFGKKLDDFS
jgi:DNA-binding protein H-NS